MYRSDTLNRGRPHRDVPRDVDMGTKPSSAARHNDYAFGDSASGMVRAKRVFLRDHDKKLWWYRTSGDEKPWSGETKMMGKNYF